MRAAWLLLALSLTVASAYLSWFGVSERAANAPDDFVNLVALLGSACGIAAGLAWARGFRKLKE